MNEGQSSQSLMAQLAEFIEQKIAELPYPKEMGGLSEQTKYALDGGGKRIRPILTLATCMALNKDADRDSAINQALGVEIFHNFTLVHDDVMDRSDMRRGRPAVRTLHGDAAAILVGDAMLTLAEMTVAKGAGDKLADVLEAFHAGSMEVYAGQELDMAFETREDVTTREYLHMIFLKTAALLRCACALGAIMAGASFEAREAIKAYAVGLGMAFQLRDDYLDTYGDEKTFGKPIGGDILNDKKTWLLSKALEEDADGRMAAVIADKSMEPEQKIAAVKAIYDELELPGKLQELVKRYSDMAVMALDDIDMSDEWRAFFIDIVRKAETRNK